MELVLFQHKYITNIFSTFNMANCKHVNTPLEVGINYSKSMTPRTLEEEQTMKQYLIPMQLEVCNI
jgi:hypothetical protein